MLRHLFAILSNLRPMVRSLRLMCLCLFVAAVVIVSPSPSKANTDDTLTASISCESRDVWDYYCMVYASGGAAPYNFEWQAYGQASVYPDSYGASVFCSYDRRKPAGGTVYVTVIDALGVRADAYQNLC